MDLNLGCTIELAGGVFKMLMCRPHKDQLNLNLWGEIQALDFIFKIRFY